MKKIKTLVMSLLLLVSLPMVAEAANPQVMMMGVFHFSNPGNDVVKTKQMNVMDAESQNYLDSLSAKIANDFSPTKIMLEYSETNSARIEAEYQAYLKGDFILPANEIYQLGFRIAKLAGAKSILSVDDRSVNWDAGPLFEVMPKIAPEIKKQIDALFEKITDQTMENHQTKNLKELLELSNDPEEDRINKNIYILTNSVASEGNHEGANATASWWHRNFNMYAKIQRAAKKGDRILVIAGQGHTAILKDILAIDGQLEGVDVRPMF